MGTGFTPFILFYSIFERENLNISFKALYMT